MHSFDNASKVDGGTTIVTFGDDCPGWPAAASGCPVKGIAVHSAELATIDDDGFVVLANFYALCCKCFMAQYIKKYGIDLVQPCGCEQGGTSDLQQMARGQRKVTNDRAAVTAAEIEEWRATNRAELEGIAAGAVTVVMPEADVPANG